MHRMHEKKSLEGEKMCVTDGKWHSIIRPVFVYLKTNNCLFLPHKNSRAQKRNKNNLKCFQCTPIKIPSTKCRRLKSTNASLDIEFSWKIPDQITFSGLALPLKIVHIKLCHRIFTNIHKKNLVQSLRMTSWH